MSPRRLRRYQDDGVVYPQTDDEDRTKIREVQLPPYPVPPASDSGED